MSRLSIIGARDRTAAKMLEISLEKFLASVSAGHLPDGREIVPGEKRWDIEALRKIVRGDVARDEEEIEW